MRPVVALAVVAALAVPLPAAAGTQAPAQLPAAAPPRVLPGGAPMFSEALWLPLRKPARVSCVRTNCRAVGEPNHGHWAIDFSGAPNDPVHAAGYGVAHVGARFNGCSRSENKRGNWVWIDHGAGEITAYTHLKSISIYQGQRVTPATIIGRMGTTGTCGPSYLHFERRLGGLHGRFVYPQSGAACIAARARVFPNAIGFGNWNQLPIKRKRTVWSEGVGCTAAPRAVAPPQTLTVAKRWRRAVKLSWAPVPGATHYAVATSKFRRKTGQWQPNRYRFTKQSTTIVRGLVPRRHYRFRVAVSRAGAHSIWGVAREVDMPR